MKKQTQRIIFIIIIIIIILVNIPSIIGEQIYNSLINNLPIVNSISTIFDFISLYQLTKSNLTETGQFLKLISLLASFVVTLLTEEKLSYIFCPLTKNEEERMKIDKIIFGTIIYFAYALIINIIILDSLFKPFIYSINDKMNFIKNSLDEIGKSLN